MDSIVFVFVICLQICIIQSVKEMTTEPTNGFVSASKSNDPPPPILLPGGSHRRWFLGQDNTGKEANTGNTGNWKTGSAQWNQRLTPPEVLQNQSGSNRHSTGVFRTFQFSSNNQLNRTNINEEINGPHNGFQWMASNPFKGGRQTFFSSGNLNSGSTFPRIGNKSATVLDFMKNNNTADMNRRDIGLNWGFPSNAGTPNKGGHRTFFSLSDVNGSRANIDTGNNAADVMEFFKRNNSSNINNGLHWGFRSSIDTTSEGENRTFYRTGIGSSARILDISQKNNSLALDKIKGGFNNQFQWSGSSPLKGRKQSFFQSGIVNGNPIAINGSDNNINSLLNILKTNNSFGGFQMFGSSINSGNLTSPDFFRDIKGQMENSTGPNNIVSSFNGTNFRFSGPIVWRSNISRSHIPYVFNTPNMSGQIGLPSYDARKIAKVNSFHVDGDTNSNGANIKPHVKAAASGTDAGHKIRHFDDGASNNDINIKPRVLSANIPTTTEASNDLNLTSNMDDVAIEFSFKNRFQINDTNNNHYPFPIPENQIPNPFAQSQRQHSSSQKDLDAIFKELELPFFERKHLKASSRDIQNELKEVVKVWMIAYEKDKQSTTIIPNDIRTTVTDNSIQTDGYETSTAKAVPTNDLETTSTDMIVATDRSENLLTTRISIPSPTTNDLESTATHTSIPTGHNAKSNTTPISLPSSATNDLETKENDNSVATDRTIKLYHTTQISMPSSTKLKVGDGDTRVPDNTKTTGIIQTSTVNHLTNITKTDLKLTKSSHSNVTAQGNASLHTNGSTQLERTTHDADFVAQRNSSAKQSHDIKEALVKGNPVEILKPSTKHKSHEIKGNNTYEKTSEYAIPNSQSLSIRVNKKTSIPPDLQKNSPTHPISDLPKTQTPLTRSKETTIEATTKSTLFKSTTKLSSTFRSSDDRKMHSMKYTIPTNQSTSTIQNSERTNIETPPPPIFDVQINKPNSFKDVQKNMNDVSTRRFTTKQMVYTSTDVIPPPIYDIKDFKSKTKLYGSEQANTPSQNAAHATDTKSVTPTNFTTQPTMIDLNKGKPVVKLEVNQQNRPELQTIDKQLPSFITQKMLLTTTTQRNNQSVIQLDVKNQESKPVKTNENVILVNTKTMDQIDVRNSGHNEQNENVIKTKTMDRRIWAPTPPPPIILDVNINYPNAQIDLKDNRNSVAKNIEKGILHKIITSKIQTTQRPRTLKNDAKTIHQVDATVKSTSKLMTSNKNKVTYNKLTIESHRTTPSTEVDLQKNVLQKDDRKISNAQAYVFEKMTHHQPEALSIWDAPPPIFPKKKIQASNQDNVFKSRQMTTPIIPRFSEPKQGVARTTSSQIPDKHQTEARVITIDARKHDRSEPILIHVANETPPTTLHVLTSGGNTMTGNIHLPKTRKNPNENRSNTKFKSSQPILTNDNEGNIDPEKRALDKQHKLNSDKKYNVLKEHTTLPPIFVPNGDLRQNNKADQSKRSFSIKVAKTVPDKLHSIVGPTDKRIHKTEDDKIASNNENNVSNSLGKGQQLKDINKMFIKTR